MAVMVMGSAAAAQQRPAADTAARDTVAADTTAPAPAQALGAPLSGWALLAYDAPSGELGLIAATNRFSAGSGVPFLEPGTGAVAALGWLDPAAGRGALAALRQGLSAQEAVTGGAGSEVAAVDSPLIAALTPGCSVAARTPTGLVPWSGSRQGSESGGCWIVAGSGLADSTLVARLGGAYARADGDLLGRFLAVLDAAGRAEADAPRTRSAVLWIVTPPGSKPPLGRPDLRLQVEDVQRPADALEAVANAGRADALAAEAERSVDRGDFQTALDLAGQALDLDPATAMAWLARGRALLFTNHPEDGEQALQRMLEVDPWLLHVLGDPLTGTIREGAIPYRPRLLKRLDIYRRAFWPNVTFPDTTAAGGG